MTNPNSPAARLLSDKVKRHALMKAVNLEVAPIAKELGERCLDVTLEADLSQEGFLDSLPAVYRFAVETLLDDLAVFLGPMHEGNVIEGNRIFTELEQAMRKAFLKRFTNPAMDVFEGGANDDG